MGHPCSLRGRSSGLADSSPLTKPPSSQIQPTSSDAPPSVSCTSRRHRGEPCFARRRIPPLTVRCQIAEVSDFSNRPSKML